MWAARSLSRLGGRCVPRSLSLSRSLEQPRHFATLLKPSAVAEQFHENKLRSLWGALALGQMYTYTMMGQFEAFKNGTLNFLRTQVLVDDDELASDPPATDSFYRGESSLTRLTTFILHVYSPHLINPIIPTAKDTHHINFLDYENMRVPLFPTDVLDLDSWRWMGAIESGFVEWCLRHLYCQLVREAAVMPTNLPEGEREKELARQLGGSVAEKEWAPLIHRARLSDLQQHQDGSDDHSISRHLGGFTPSLRIHQLQRLLLLTRWLNALSVYADARGRLYDLEGDRVLGALLTYAVARMEYVKEEMPKAKRDLEEMRRKHFGTESPGPESSASTPSSTSSSSLTSWLFPRSKSGNTPNAANPQISVQNGIHAGGQLAEAEMAVATLHYEARMWTAFSHYYADTLLNLLRAGILPRGEPYEESMRNVLAVLKGRNMLLVSKAVDVLSTEYLAETATANRPITQKFLAAVFPKNAVQCPDLQRAVAPAERRRVLLSPEAVDGVRNAMSISYWMSQAMAAIVDAPNAPLDDDPAAFSVHKLAAAKHQQMFDTGLRVVLITAALEHLAEHSEHIDPSTRTAIASLSTDMHNSLSEFAEFADFGTIPADTLAAADSMAASLRVAAFGAVVAGTYNAARYWMRYVWYSRSVLPRVQWPATAAAGAGGAAMSSSAQTKRWRALLFNAGERKFRSSTGLLRFLGRHGVRGALAGGVFGLLLAILDPYERFARPLESSAIALTRKRMLCEMATESAVFAALLAMAQRVPFLWVPALMVLRMHHQMSTEAVPEVDSPLVVDDSLL